MRAPAPHLVAGFDCKHQQNDEANKHQEAQDNGYDLRRAQDTR